LGEFDLGLIAFEPDQVEKFVGDLGLNGWTDPGGVPGPVSRPAGLAARSDRLGQQHFTFSRGGSSRFVADKRVGALVSVEFAAGALRSPGSDRPVRSAAPAM